MNRGGIGAADGMGPAVGRPDQCRVTRANAPGPSGTRAASTRSLCLAPPGDGSGVGRGVEAKLDGGQGDCVGHAQALAIAVAGFGEQEFGAYGQAIGEGALRVGQGPAAAH